jgi:hypothetical protein
LRPQSAEDLTIPPYSLFADWLSKFHLWPESIQALWLVAGAVTVVGVTAVVARTLREIVGLLPGRGRAARVDDGELVYGVYRDRRGRWMVYRHGREVREVDWTDPPPELTGREPVARGFARPER